ncbi:hypothetical protein SAMN05443428_11160 [Caloramator quimbayensis]|uniref:Uncharacterized protein n=2 Tax=Caloramator quimbayensis TaxID=1147123 RepID=A0A1T4XPK0_9CLOT|nr:hypothetical protein SAMN05443428_11160 [Caloramator quimbayensis]
MQFIELGETTVKQLHQATVTTTYEDYQHLQDCVKWLEELTTELNKVSDYDEKNKKFIITASAEDIKNLVSKWFNK